MTVSSIRRKPREAGITVRGTRTTTVTPAGTMHKQLRTAGKLLILTLNPAGMLVAPKLDRVDGLMMEKPR